MAERESLNTRLFLLETPSMVERLGRAIHVRNRTETEREANSLKAVAARIGAARLRERAWRVELMAQAGDLIRARILFRKLRSDVEKMSCELVETL